MTEKRLGMIWWWATMAMVALAISACAGNAPVHRAPSPQPAAAAPGPSEDSVEAVLRQTADRWFGTPHRLGGLDTRGIDCSGLVLRVYREAFGLSLPRTTVLQVRTGRPIARGRWQSGDLVFFKPPSWKGRHVGIYLGGNEFLHASASTGVTISRIDSGYWRKAYWTTRRVLRGG